MFSIIATFLVMKNKIDAEFLFFTIPLDVFSLLVIRVAVFGE